jgi:hypothetical protein
LSFASKQAIPPSITHSRTTTCVHYREGKSKDH